MVDKYFPIKTGVACPLKWTWNTVRLQEGTTASCHRVVNVPLDLENFDSFHNNETWISHRKMQLAGEFPQAGCQYCENIEKAGGVSDRMTHLKIPNLVPPELEADPTALVVTPRILEVFLDNTCNLACIYCDESNSTRIEHENKKFGYEIKGIPIINQIDRHKDFEQLQDKFFLYLKKNYHHFKRLHILGGEPFFQDSFSRLMSVVESNTNPDLELNIVTNLMVSEKKLQKFIDTVKQLILNRQIKRLDITVSLDGWGPEQEYIRYGLNLKTFQQNFELLLKHKWIIMNVNGTITSLSIRTMPELIKILNQYRSKRKIHHTFSLVDNRPHLHPRIFGPGFFDKDFDNIINCMTSNTEWTRNQLDYMIGIKKSLSNSVENREQLRNLKLYLDELDRRRNLNWYSLFPWLNEYFKESNITDVV